jgi:hypothetical protein
MRKALLYHASVALCGAALGLIGLFSVASGSVTVVSVLLSVGGLGMTAGAVYETFLTPDPSESTPGDRTVWFTAAMAAIAVIAGLWSLIV